MGTLVFLCPSTGHTVFTGIETDAVSFRDIPRVTTYLSCPHCPAPHRMLDVQAWLGDVNGKPLQESRVGT